MRRAADDDDVGGGGGGDVQATPLLSLWLHV
jgi:hypothetical protein